MITYKLASGQIISLTIDSDFYKEQYESKIISVSSDFLEIGVPYYKGLLVPISVGSELNLNLSMNEVNKALKAQVVSRNVDTHSIVVKPIRDALSNFEIKSYESFNNCKFVVVTSGKGGVGKTSFIINYALALVERGKRVVLLDADLGMANVDVLLKLKSKYNIIDVIEGSKTLQDIMITDPTGLRVIPGGSGIQELANLSMHQFERITAGFHYLGQNYDYVLIDTGAGLSKNTTNFILISDETIVVTTPEPHAITDAYSIIKVVLEKNRDIKLKLMVNKCENKNEGQAVIERVVKVVKKYLNYDITPVGCILENKIMTKSLKDQIPLCLSHPTSDIIRAIDEFADNEVGNLRKQPVFEVSEFLNKFKSIFGRNLKSV